MHFNPEARDITIEVLVNRKEKAAADELRKALGLVGLSTLFRNTVNAAVQRHGKAASNGREPGGCPGRGRFIASRASVTRGAINGRRTN